MSDGDLQDEIAKRAATQALENAKDAVQKKVDAAPTSTKLKWLLGIVGVVVLGVSFMALVAKLWTYAILAVIVGGIGFGTYLVVKPKLKALKEQAEAKLLAGKREREEREKVDAVASAAAAKAKKLEDELAALKKKA